MLCWAILNLPLLLGFRVLPGDAMDEFYPMVYFNVHALRSGLAPWWNPDIFAGYPQIADPQAMLFAPLFMAWMLLRSDPGTTWYVWGALWHVLLGGIGMAALLRRLKATDVGAIFGALVFMAGGVAASRIQYVPILLVYCFIPVALLCVRRFVDRPGLTRGMVMGAVAGCMLVEPVQLTYLAGVPTALYAALMMARRCAAWTRRSRWQAALGVTAAVLVAGVMAVPQLLFSHAFLVVSNRPELDLNAASVMSVDWRSLWTLVSPNAMQSLRGTYNGPVDPIETFFYIGAIASLLLLVGLCGAWRNRSQRRHLLFFGVTACVGIAYLLGGHTPFYEALYRWVPGVNLFRRPSDSAYLLNLGLAMAVGFAASHVDMANRRKIIPILMGATAWLAISCITMRGEDKNWQVATVIAPLSAAAVAFWAIRRPRGAGAITIALVGLLVVDYRCFNLNGEFNQRSDSGKRFRADPAADFVAARLRDRAAKGDPSRIEALDLGAGWKNLVVLKDIQAVHGYGPLRWVVFDRYFGAYSDGNGPRPTSSYNLTPASSFSRLLGVRYIVQPAGAEMASWRLGTTRAEVVHRDDKSDVIEISPTSPRVLTPLSGAVSAPGGVDVDILAGLDPERTVWLTPRDETEIASLHDAVTDCPSAEVTARMTGATNIRTTLVVDGHAGGWVVLADPDFPGWVASIDGKETPHWRADGLLRALCVLPGHHTVEYRFHPWRMVGDVMRRPNAWR